MIRRTLPQRSPPMKSYFSHERSLVQLDPTAFLADPELIRALSEHATPIVCDTDRVLFQQDDPSVGLYILLEGEAMLSMTSIQGQAILSVTSERRFPPRPPRTRQQPALLAHSGRARRSAGELSRPRGIHRADGIEPVAGIQDPAGSCGRGALGPQRALLEKVV